MAAKTNYKLSGLKQYRCITLRFRGSEVFNRSHQTKVSMLTDFVEQDPFSAHADRWQNSVPWGCMTECPAFLLAVSRAHPPLPQGTAAFHNLRLPSSIFKGHRFGLSLFHASNLPSFSSVSFLWPTQKGSLLWRIRWLDWGHPDYPE